jgi:hypothetical protein
LLVVIPLAFPELRPEATRARLKRTQDLLLSHALQLTAGIAGTGRLPDHQRPDTPELTASTAVTKAAASAGLVSPGSAGWGLLQGENRGLRVQPIVGK